MNKPNTASSQSQPSPSSFEKVKNSSNITEIGYHPDSKTLHVKFQGGSHYTYHGVHPTLWEQLRKAPSKGSFIHQFIKGKHETKKLS
jgi:hypothetical protein